MARDRGCAGCGSAVCVRRVQGDMHAVDLRACLQNFRALDARFLERNTVTVAELKASDRRRQLPAGGAALPPAGVQAQ